MTNTNAWIALILIVFLIGGILTYSTSCSDSYNTNLFLEIPQLNVDNATYNAVSLSWDSIEHAESYIINRYRQFKSYTSVVELGQTTETTFTDATVFPETSYFYGVIAVNNYAKSTESAWIGVVTGSVTLQPFTPTDGDSLCSVNPQFTWEDAAIANTIYRLQVASDSAFTNLVLEITTNATSFDSLGYMTFPSGSYYWRYLLETDTLRTDFSTIHQFDIVASVNPPTVDSFTLTSAPISTDPVVTFDLIESGTLCSNVTHWLITEDSIQPVPTDFVHTVRPTSHTITSGFGIKSIYAWVLDNAGNVSQVFTPITVEYCDPSILYVRTAGDDTDIGHTPGTALKTIGEAFTRAGSDPVIKEIRVAQGTYQQELTLNFDILFYGGYNADFSVRDPSTTISRITAPDNVGNTLIIHSSDVSNACMIDGFRILGSKNNTVTDGTGNGILVTNNAAPTLQNLVVAGGSGNTKRGCGNGIFIYDGANPIIDQCTLTGGDSNSDQHSGMALYSLQATGVIQNCTLQGGKTNTGADSSFGIGIIDETTPHSIQKNAITGGDFSSTSVGIAMVNANPVIMDNAMITTSGTIDIAYGIFIDGGNCESAIISGNYIEAGKGTKTTAIYTKTNCSITNNTIVGGVSSANNATHKLIQVVDAPATTNEIRGNSLSGTVSDMIQTFVIFHIVNSSPTIIQNTFTELASTLPSFPNTALGFSLEATTAGVDMIPRIESNTIPVPSAHETKGIQIVRTAVTARIIDPQLVDNIITVGAATTLNSYGIHLSGNAVRMNTCTGNTISAGEANGAGSDSVGLFLAANETDQVTIGPGNTINASGAENNSIGIFSNSGTDAEIIENVEIAGGTSSGNDSFGIVGVQGEDLHIYGNQKITAGDAPTGSSIGIYLDFTGLAASKSILIARNYIYAGETCTDSVGVTLSGYCNAQFRNNYVFGGWGSNSSTGVIIENLPVSEDIITLHMNTINGGKSANFVRALSIYDNAHPNVFNNIFTCTSTDIAKGRGVISSSTSEPRIFRNNFFYNCPEYLYNNDGVVFQNSDTTTSNAFNDLDLDTTSTIGFESSFTAAATVTQNLVLDIEPASSSIFVDAANHDYHLVNSIVPPFPPVPIDKGYSPAAGLAFIDIDGEIRPAGLAFDIGYDEYH